MQKIQDRSKKKHLQYVHTYSSFAKLINLIATINGKLKKVSLKYGRVEWRWEGGVNMCVKVTNCRQLK